MDEDEIESPDILDAHDLIRKPGTKQLVPFEDLTEDEYEELSTAPKDGTRVELINANNKLRDVGHWCDYHGQSITGIEGEWSTDLGNGDMTHWRPISAEAGFLNIDSKKKQS